MKVLRVKIQNFKNLGGLDVPANGNLVYLIGGNGSGKTSFIQAIYVALTGKDMPPNALKAGEKKGEIEVEIGEGEDRYTINLKFSEAQPRGTLTLTGANGNKIASPRAFLDNIIGGISFDPFDFIGLSGAKQVAFIKELVGLDFTELDKEYKHIEENRKLTGRDRDTLSGKIKESGIQEHEYSIFTEEKDTTEIQKKITAASENNAKIEGVKEKLKGLGTAIQEIEKKYAETDKEIEDLREKIKSLEALKLELTSHSNKAQENIKLGEAWLEKNKPVDITAAQTELTTAINFNKKVKEVTALKNDIAKLDGYTGLYTDYTSQLRAIEDEKRGAIAAAPMPVPGLGFTDEYLTLNGLPFDTSQLSTGVIIKAGIEIMMALNPKLKICRIKNGSLLDATTFKELLNEIKENGFQAFIEIVEPERGQLQVTIEEAA